MTRAYNFSPGPAALPDAVMLEAQAAFYEFRDWRASVMEVSHRSAAFLEVHRETEALLRELLAIGEEYAVLFLTGGATGQAAAVPLNLTAAGEGAAYLISGHWSRRAADEAKRFCRVHIVGDSADTGYTTLPALASPPDDAVYLHLAENETVHGVEYARLPATTLPIVADMSSNIGTRVIDVNNYGLIYAGAQKNLGIAGITIVIVRRDLVRPRSETPSVWDYGKQAAIESMYNTPPTFQLYMVGRVLDWMRRQGGVVAMEQAAAARATLLYRFLDESDFYQTPVLDAACRSRINVPFFLADERLTADFLAGADARGLLGLKGHKALGGVRVSMYNSMPLAGVAALVEYLREFEKERG